MVEDLLRLPVTSSSEAILPDVPVETRVDRRGGEADLVDSWLADRLDFFILTLATFAMLDEM